MEQNLTNDIIKQLTELGRSLGAPVVLPDGDPILVLPSGFKTEDISRFAPPTRIKAEVVLTEPGSFASYINKFRDGDTALFARVTDTGASFVAVLDYHRKVAGWDPESGVPRGPLVPVPQYCAHRAFFTCEETTEWKEWIKANGQRMEQEEFAVWLEEHQDLIVDPPGAELLELVQNLEGKNHVRFNSAMRLQSGRNQLMYDEDVELRGTVTTTTGAIQIPQTISAGIAPFQGITKYKVVARLKYRIESRKVTFWFETVSPHRVVRDAIKSVVEQIEKATDLMVLQGALK